jgi:uncharacterized delta-60 repeat protein
MAFQADGKVVLAGETYSEVSGKVAFMLYRFDSKGSFDNSFDNDGKLTDTEGLLGYTDYTSTASQSDGKLVVAGKTWNGSNFDLVLTRYNTNGSLDNQFGSDGSTIINFGSEDDAAKAVAIQPDGKIVVAVSNAIVRFNADGKPDSSFDGDGIKNANYTISSLAIADDGKIVVAGSAVARYNVDGNLDNTFNGGRIQTADLTLLQWQFKRMKK